MIVIPPPQKLMNKTQEYQYKCWSVPIFLINKVGIFYDFKNFNQFY